ncbi:hypothetical protein AGMMS49942_12340 [Spirochaetia bacterium]|nr:hypothetical protein AGMMS49942_12340 [Spirochaetia bacterium]
MHVGGNNMHVGGDNMLVDVFLKVSLLYKVLFVDVTGPERGGYVKVIPGTYFFSYLILALKAGGCQEKYVGFVGF